ncbi:unnamed protein product [Urochloa decumbens]|uniref:Uncharacterized protein n=1 Tax=Urochloa decumbens TaxID=240449 RepID=A0ABC9EZ21_9POAL
MTAAAGGFLPLLAVSSMPVAELLLIAAAGAYLATARCGVLTPSARADINRVVYAVFTPALMLASLASTVTLRDVAAWWFMPVNIGIAFLAGGGLGWVAVLLLRPPQQLRGLVVASCSAANFGNLLLVVIPAVCEQDGNPFGLPKKICSGHGLSYASFSMALGGVYIWTYTHSVMKRSGEAYRRMRQQASSIVPVACVVDPKESVIPAEEDKDQSGNDDDRAISSPPSQQSVVEKGGEHLISVPLLSRSGNHHQGAESKSLWEKMKQGTRQMTQELTSPPTTGAVIGLVIGTVPWLRSVFVGSNAPLRALQDALKLLGDGTIPCLMLILGGNLTKGVRKTKVPPAVVAAIVCVRYVILPLVGVAVVRAARDMGFLPPDPLYQYTLMMHFAVPPAMSIGTMSQLYDVGQEECSVILLWTYLVAALALTVWSTVFMWILQ